MLGNEKLSKNCQSGHDEGNQVEPQLNFAGSAVGQDQDGDRAIQHDGRERGPLCSVPYHCSCDRGTFGGPVAMRLGVGGSWSSIGRTCWGEFAVGGLGSVGVVVEAPVLDDHAGFEKRVESPRVDQLVTQPAAERLDPGVLPRRAGSMKMLLVPLNRHQSFTA